jgi:alpha-amylase/alpha-mannosidase (GH57 family)
VSEVVLSRFPEYKALREKFRASGADSLTEQELREIKLFFYLANFDPDFLERKVKLVTGETVDLTDLIIREADGTYRLRKSITEDDCNRVVAEAYKVLAAIVPVHKKLMYRRVSGRGQLEIATTPFYHPILPLVYDSDLAKQCQPNDPLPPRFHFPQDAEAQVAKAVEAFAEHFGVRPTGMWPAEGAVAQELVPVFARFGIQWIATDEKILARSQPPNMSKHSPYVITGDGIRNAVVIVFRDTELSDKIGFTYQHFRGEDAADDFVRHILWCAPGEHEPDRLLTVILDGENAWEWYRYDNDGKEFQHALYRKLSRLHETRQVVTTTVTEYIHGNPLRGIPAHPLETLPKLERLWPGSWINANYDTWIGEEEENRAWEYLLTARDDLGRSGVRWPNPTARPPKKGTRAWHAYMAWESLYAAEGSDWFWWYGTDQTAPAGDKPFDRAFITHLQNIYTFGRLANGNLPEREFAPIVRETVWTEEAVSGTMARSREDLVTVVFQVDCRSMYVRRSIYIVGNHALLGNWVPNKVRMYDDGTHGDTKGDGTWTLEVQLPPGAEIQYKFTNSGPEGRWEPGDEIPGLHRTIRVSDQKGSRQVLFDTFGRI